MKLMNYCEFVILFFVVVIVVIVVVVIVVIVTDIKVEAEENTSRKGRTQR